MYKCIFLFFITVNIVGQDFTSLTTKSAETKLGNFKTHANTELNKLFGVSSEKKRITLTEREKIYYNSTSSDSAPQEGIDYNCLSEVIANADSYIAERLKYTSRQNREAVGIFGNKYTEYYDAARVTWHLGVHIVFSESTIDGITDIHKFNRAYTASSSISPYREFENASSFLSPTKIINEAFSVTYKNNITNPIISANCFENIPYKDFTSTVSKSRDVAFDPGCWEEITSGVFIGPTSYKLLRANPTTAKVIFPKRILTSDAPDDRSAINPENTFPGMSNLQVSTGSGVKIILLQIFDFSTGSFVEQYYASATTDAGVVNLSISTSRLKNIPTGKYKCVLSLINKFNRIEYYEPMYLTIDKEAPTVDWSGSCDIREAFKSEYSIATLTSLADNSLTINESELLKDGFYYKMQGEIEKHVTIGRTDETESFYVDGNSIKVCEGAFNTTKYKFQGIIPNKDYILEYLVLRDNAGNSYSLLSHQPMRFDNKSPTVNDVLELQNSVLSKDTALEFNFSDANNNNEIDTMPKIIIKSFSVDLINRELKSINISNLIKDSTPDVESGKCIYKLDSSLLSNEEGTLTVSFTFSDLADNEVLKNFIYNYDNKNPDISFYLDNTKNENENFMLNNKHKIEFDLIDNNIKKIHIKGTSSNPESKWNFDLTDDTHAGNIYKYIKDSFIRDTTTDVPENVKITVEVIDIHERIAYIEKLFSLNIDNEAPIITITDSTSDYYDYNVIDATTMKVFKKIISIKPTLATELSDFGFLPTYIDDKGWEKLLDVGTIYNDFQYVPSKYAICIYAVDYWENATSTTYKIIENTNTRTITIINNRNDLVIKDFKLWGDVQLTDTINLLEDDTLEFTTKDGVPTNIMIYTTNNNGIQIVNNGNISFTNESRLNFFNLKGQFKGILNEFNEDTTSSGQVLFDNTGDVVFHDTTIPLTYYLPTHNLELKNVMINNAKIGIHQVTDINSVKQITLEDVIFNSPIYAIKLDLTGDGSYTQPFPVTEEGSVQYITPKRGKYYITGQGVTK